MTFVFFFLASKLKHGGSGNGVIIEGFFNRFLLIDGCGFLHDELDLIWIMKI